MPLVQSGNVTPGHIALWTTTGVLEDGGALGAAQRVLASLPNADFNSTGDQPISIPNRITAFQLTGIIITNASINLSMAVGGFYPAASKGGTPIVSAAQVYSTLTAREKLLQATLASFGSTTRFSSANLGLIASIPQIWFSLTTPQAAVATADIYLIGIDLTV